MEMLINEKEKMDTRNEEFLKSTGNYTKQFSKALPDLMEAEDNLRKAKSSYLAYLDKKLRWFWGSDLYICDLES